MMKGFTQGLGKMSRSGTASRGRISRRSRAFRSAPRFRERQGDQ